MSEAPVKLSNREKPKQAGMPLSLARGAAHWLSPERDARHLVVDAVAFLPIFRCHETRPIH